MCTSFYAERIGKLAIIARNPCYVKDKPTNVTNAFTNIKGDKFFYTYKCFNRKNFNKSLNNKNEKKNEVK